MLNKKSVVNTNKSQTDTIYTSLDNARCLPTTESAKTNQINVNREGSELTWGPYELTL